MATLAEVFDRSASGHGTGIVVSGDAGVGKSRLLAEAVARASEQGWTVLIGHCLDFGDAAVPFLPLREMYGRFADEHPARAAVMLAAHPAVARLLPAHRQVENQPDRPHRPDPADRPDRAEDRFDPLAPTPRSASSAAHDPAAADGPGADAAVEADVAGGDESVAAETADARPAAQGYGPGRAVGMDGAVSPAVRGSSTAFDVADTRADRSTLFEAIAASWDGLAGAGPALIVIEDLHWADQSTRELLGFVFARLGSQALTVVGSYRSDDLHRRHPLRRVLAEWTRLPAIQRLDVQALADRDVAALVRDIDPGLLGVAVDAVVQRAGGNAFYAEELAAAGGGDALPGELADVLLVRFERLSDTARRVVRLLAVAGRPTSHELLSVVSDVEDAALDAALREAVEAHLIEIRPSGYGFHHALMGEAIGDDLLPGERARIHATFVVALTNDAALGSAAEAAHHARGAHDLDSAYREGVRAGDEADELDAPAEAARQYELALDLFDRVSDPDSVRPRWRLVTDLTDALVAAGFPDRARDLLTIEVPRAGGLDPMARAELLLRSAQVQYYFDDLATAHTMVDEALGLLVEQAANTVTIGLLGLKARIVDGVGRWREAREVAEQAVSMADSLASVSSDRVRRSIADARATVAILSRRTAEPEQAAAGLRELADYAHRVDAGSVELRSRYGLANVNYEAGHLEAAIDAYSDAVAVAERIGQRWSPYGASALLVGSLVRYEAGYFDEALHGLDHTAVPPVLLPSVRAVRALVLAARGQGDAALARATRSSWPADPQVVIMGAAAEAEVIAAADGLNAGREHLDAAMELVAEVWPPSAFMARIRMTALGLAMVADAAPAVPAAERDGLLAWGESRLHAARRAEREAVPSAREVGPEGRAWSIRLEAEWGRLRHGLGEDAGSASDHVERWTAAAEAFGYGARYEQARSRTHLAFAHRAAGHLDRAREVAGQARDAARQMGAVPLLIRLEALAVPSRKAPGRPPRPSNGNGRGGPHGSAASTVGLTAREQEVVELIALGHTNRQISRQLFISEKTVSVHVSNVLAKLGAAGRTEAAAIARRQGLITDVTAPRQQPDGAERT